MTGILTFDVGQVRALLADAHRKWAAALPRRFYGMDVGPQIMLVGDEGVYLMHNGVNETKPMVVYAKECNPIEDPEGYYEAKREIFGGDDSAELLSVAQITTWLGERSSDVKIEINRQNMVLI